MLIKKIRVLLACCMVVGFCFLFLDQSEGSVVARKLAWLADIQLVPALLAGSLGIVIALLALTLVYGRIYCSLICPLGLLQDLLRSLSKTRRYTPLKAQPLIRYAFLLLFVLALLAGLPVFFTLLEPYSAFGRIATALGLPLAVLSNNGLDFLTGGNSLLFVPKTVFMQGIATVAVAIVTLLILLWCTLTYGRIWCSLICPVGTFLGLLSRWSLFRPRIDAKTCTSCGACARSCKTGCIDAEQGIVDASRCVACYNCLDACKFSALHLRPTHTETKPVSAERRAFLGALGFCALSKLADTPAYAASSEKSEAEILHRRYKERRFSQVPLLPAGAQSQNHFTQKCTGCQLCVSRCPSHVLISQDRGLGLLQPEMSFAHGFCRVDCVRCSEICPTDAIRPISKEEKSSIQIGRAQIDLSLCVVTTDHVSCNACQRNCPTGAVSLVGERELPSVHAEKCIGCGACEFYCPARPQAAIRVEANHQHHNI